MIWTDDPERDFARWDADQAEQEAELPVCDFCGYPIQSEYLYEVLGQCICEDCMSNCKHEVDEYMEVC